MAGVVIVDPTAPCPSEPQQRCQTLDGLAGKVIGFIHEAKLNFNRLVDDLRICWPASMALLLSSSATNACRHAWRQKR